MGQVEKTEREWRDELGPQRYEVMRQKATEPPFTGKYVNAKDKGTYRCGACGVELFTSDTKFDSGSGWPSFTEPANRVNVELVEDEGDAVGPEQSSRDHLAAAFVVDLVPMSEDELEPTLGQREPFTQVVQILEIQLFA